MMNMELEQVSDKLNQSMDSPAAISTGHGSIHDWSQPTMQ